MQKRLKIARKLRSGAESVRSWRESKSFSGEENIPFTRTVNQGAVLRTDGREESLGGPGQEQGVTLVAVW